MSAVSQVLASEPVSAQELVTRMGVSFATLCSAIHTDVAHLSDSDPSSWRPIANLWRETSALFGGEDNARTFLNQPRPELGGETPLHFLNTGEPGVVHNLVIAIREMLP
jgi:uncharacterized protein (DUF2384 family)